MRITRQVVVLDAADISAVSNFWAGVLGGRVDEDGDWGSGAVGRGSGGGEDVREPRQVGTPPLVVTGGLQERDRGV